LTCELIEGYDIPMKPTFVLNPTTSWIVAAALWLLLCLPGMGQLVVYEMDFERTGGFNDQPFTGGYFVAPVAGGTGSFLFTQGGGGAVTIVPAEDTGRLFRAVTDDGEVKWVAQAQVGVASTTTDDETTDDETDDTTTDEATVNDVNVATGSFLAVGNADYSATFRTPLVTFETRIAKTMRGRNITASSAPVNGSTTRIGFVSRGDWKLKFDSKETNEVNRQDMDLATATQYLEGLLEGSTGGVVDRRMFILTDATLPAAVVAVAYDEQLESSGGIAPRSWQVASASSLPAGLTLTSAGRLSGTVNTAGTFTFTLILSDSSNPPQTLSRVFSLTVQQQLTITTASPLATGQVDMEYTPVTLAASGALGALTWDLNPGSPFLPAGMTLATNGQLSGTPTVSGVFSFTVRLRDASSGQSTTKNFDLTIDP
jgi:hypothetical protein